MIDVNRIIDALIGVGCRDEYVIEGCVKAKDIIEKLMASNNVTKPDYFWAHMIAQTAAESNDFSRLEENLYYSAERLMQVWPRRFPDIARALEYDKDPEKLANHVYGKRMGNTDRGDGWKFRGRGWIQMTGYIRYKRATDELGIDFVKNPDFALEMDVAWVLAAWYMATASRKGKSIIEYIEDDDVRGVTLCINGGMHGFERRVAETEEAKIALGLMSRKFKPLKIGSFGVLVKDVQRKLKNLGYAVSLDGQFGPNLKSKVMAFQQKNMLVADGVVGKLTFRALDL